MDYTPIKNAKTWEKFDSNGDARLHRGTTIVSRLNAECDVFRVGQRIQNDLRGTELGGQFALTPSNSFHMTVLEGLKDRPWLNKGEDWPDWLDAETFPAAVYKLRQRIIDEDVEPAPQLRMKVSGVRPVAESLTITVEPEDAEMRERLSAFRESVARAWDITVPSLDDYFFHITLGYRLSDPGDTRDLNEELTEKYGQWSLESGTPRLERPAFTVFDDMLAFPPVLYL